MLVVVSARAQQVGKLLGTPGSHSGLPALVLANPTFPVKLPDKGTTGVPGFLPPTWKQRKLLEPGFI